MQRGGGITRLITRRGEARVSAIFLERARTSAVAVISGSLDPALDDDELNLINSPVVNARRDRSGNGFHVTRMIESAGSEDRIYRLDVIDASLLSLSLSLSLSLPLRLASGSLLAVVSFAFRSFGSFLQEASIFILHNAFVIAACTLYLY